MVDQLVGGESVFREPGSKRGMGEQSAPAVEQEIWGTAEQEPQMGSGALQTVVEDPQDLLIVSGTSLGVSQLSEVDHFVEADKQAIVASHAYETGHQLDVVVPGGG